MITVRDILNADPSVHCSIAAGVGGLDKEIQIITSIESPKSVEKLKGGELVLCAGVLFEDDGQKLTEFVDLLIKQGSIALGLKTRFIRCIPDEVLDLANANDFMIVSLPDELVWSHLFAAFYQLQLAQERSGSIVRTTKKNFNELLHLSKYGRASVQNRFVEILTLAAVITDNSYQILAQNQHPSVQIIIEYIYDFKGYQGKAKAQDGIAQIGSSSSMRYKNYRITDIVLSRDSHLILTHSSKSLTLEEIDMLQSVYENLLRDGQSELTEDDLSMKILNDLVMNTPTLNLSDIIAKPELQRSAYVISVATGNDWNKYFSEIRAQAQQSEHFSDLHVSWLEYNGTNQTKFIALWGMNAKPTSEADWVRCFKDAFNSIPWQDTNLRVFFGDPLPFSGNIRKSYSQALLCLRYGQQLPSKSHIMFYREVDALATLESNGLRFDEILLLDQSIKSFNACETLEAYLEYRSLKQAASAIFIHENTMRYRISKIQQVLNMDLTSSLVALNLQMKLKLYRLSGRENNSDRPLGYEI